MSQTTVVLPKAIASFLLEEDGDAARKFAKRVHDDPAKSRIWSIAILHKNFLDREPFITSLATKKGILIPAGDTEKLAINVLDALLHLCYPAEEAQTSG